MDAYLRYCPDCGEEYQPHMTKCVECGGVLQDMREGHVPETPPAPEIEPTLPPGEYVLVADGLSRELVETVVRRLVEARIPVKVGTRGHGLNVSARDEDRAAVVAALERAGAIPEQPEAGAPAVATDGGPCPACGTSVPAGTVECPECGLRLSAACENCGADPGGEDHVCRACGEPLD